MRKVYPIINDSSEVGNTVRCKFGPLFYNHCGALPARAINGFGLAEKTI